MQLEVIVSSGTQAKKCIYDFTSNKRKLEWRKGWTGEEGKYGPRREVVKKSSIDTSAANFKEQIYISKNWVSHN